MSTGTEATAPARTAVHPADPVAAVRAMAPLVAAHQDQMDRDRCLPLPVVEALRATGILRAAVPPELGGPQYDPATQVRMVEELSRQDGSVGWCAMIASAGSFANGFLSPEAARRWFGPADSCLAGQIAPTGRAVRVPGGYRVSGRFRFASGSGHATFMIAGCLVYDGDELQHTDRGRPLMCIAILPVERCTVVDTWHTTGLWGTGSNDYIVDNVQVAEEDTWDPAGRMRRTEPLFRYPPLFLVPHAGVPLGLARAAIDAVLELAGHKPPAAGAAGTGAAGTLRDDERAQEAVAVAEAELAASRAFTYDTIADLWSTLEAGDRVSPRQRAMYRIMMTWTHQRAKDIVASMYDTAAGSAIYRDNPLDRTMRDILTACQHRMIHPRLYRPAGRLLLGLGSGDPLV
jgi:alkylation response protein AidB-like acyl-CoA dehydrogenase